MARHINVSQLKSQLRQIEQKQRSAINNYNNAVRRYNSQVNRAIDNYNRFVREYNSNVRRNRQIINREIGKLNSSSHGSFGVTIRTMQTHYAAVNTVYHEGYEVTPEQSHILDLIEQEQANSI